MEKKIVSMRLFRFLYMGVLFMILMLVITVLYTRTGSGYDRTKKRYEEISADFRLEPDGQEPVDFDHLSKYYDPKVGSVEVYYRIPTLSRDQTLIYRSKDVYTSVYVDDTLIYHTNVPESSLYNDSPGNLWNELFLLEEYSGKLLTIKADVVYDENAITVDSLYLGDGSNIIVHFVHEKLFAIFVSILMILMGCAFVVTDLISQNRMYNMGHAMLFLGIYSFLIGMWCLLETNIIQFFVIDQRILQMCNNIIMITAFLPLFIYLDYMYGVLQQRIIRYFCYLNLAFMIISVLAQLFRITDFHHVLPGSQMFMLLGSLLFLGCMIKECVKRKKNQDQYVTVVLQMVGIGSLVGTVFFEYFKYLEADSIDRAGGLRIGSLFFVVFYGISTHIQTSKLIEKGMQYNVVKNLAYQDGLTKLGNRTSYLEKIDEYIHSDISCFGIVFMDVNNLKLVNDTYGHEVGDDLLMKSADIIAQSFGEFGNCYRIGGDEFCVFMEGDDPQSSYQESLVKFEQLIAECNENKKKLFDISIAQGFSLCEKLTREDIFDAISKADQVMYENKSIMKCKRSS